MLNHRIEIFRLPIAALLLLFLPLVPCLGAGQDPAILQRANQVYGQGQYEAALRLYQEGCASAPGDWICHQNIGMCYYWLNRLDEAIVSFNRSIALGETAITRLSLGQAYNLKANYPEAVRNLRRSIELDPSSPVAWNSLASACFDRGWYPEAIQASETGLKKGPPPEGAQVLRDTMMLSYVALGRYPEAYAIAGQRKLTHMEVDKTADGLKVTRVLSRGPADLAGIRSGDILVSFSGKRIAEHADLLRAFDAAAFGSVLPVELRRAGKSEKTALVVGITPDLAAQAAAARASAATVLTERGRASIRIRQLRLNPSAVSAGTKFDVEVEYSVSEPSATEGALIPIQFSYTVTTGGKTILSEPAATVQAPSGKSAIRVLHLTAARRPGTYVIRINMRSEGSAAEESVEFQTH
jgi:tetratricopeptide (TPR) repeat protein